ncbi:MAG: PilN domain-containing protein [Haliea sp.]|uniref:PilN domain-containing protein n=1 Tax=Haliea sp. TaxID=1932666 RepID=UPI0032ED1F06
MQTDSRRWSLFGLDLEPWIQAWRAGWHELFWGRAAGIRRRLEAPVALRKGSEPDLDYFVAEEPMAAAQAPDFVFDACLLPAELVLLRHIELPASLEAELADAVMLEVQASSPFVLDDTCYGWALRRRAGGKLHLTLAITACSEAMSYLHAQGVTADSRETLPELWCLDEEQRPVVFQGFGEGRRAGNYRRRLALLGGLLATLLLLFMALLAVPGVVRGMQADNMEYHLAAAERDAVEAMQLREQLAVDNDRAQAVQVLVDRQLDSHSLLDRLAAQTPDSVYFEQLMIEDRQIRIRGWAVNAARFLQSLTEDPYYAEVSAPGGTRRHGRTNLEQFTLELHLAEVTPD